MKVITKKVRHAATVLAISSLAFSFSGVVIANEPALGQKGDTHVDPNSYLVRSTDGGKKWQEPISPPNISPEIHYTPFGDGIPAYNRGALYEGKSERIFWAVAATDNEATRKTSVHLITSDDKGLNWTYRSPIAVDENVVFNEIK